MYNVLVLEDDIDLSEILSVYLTSHNYTCAVANTYHKAVALFEAQRFDIVITDMMLPDGNGCDFCAHIRRQKTTPIIVISCLGDDETIVSAFSAGADDYITKPISHNQLLARLEANIRRVVKYNTSRTSIISEEEELQFCNMTLNRRYRTLTNVKGSVELSPIELSILSLFLLHPNELITYNSLYEFVWGKNSLGDYRAVMVHVSNLKKKMDSSNRNFITNVRGSGYIFSNT